MIKATIIKDYTLDIARGDVLGTEPFGAYGKRIVTGASPLGLLWANGVWSIPSIEGEQIRIVSTSTEDAVGGTGVSFLHLHYLDTELKPKFEIIELEGTTPVTSNATDIRFVQCAHVEVVGIAKSAVGIIDFTNLSGTKGYNQIGVGEIRCTSSLRMVPKDKRAVVLGLIGSAVSNTASTSAMISIGTSYFYNNDYTQQEVLIPLSTIAVQDNSVTYTLPIPHIVPEGTLIGMTCETDGKATVVGGWFGWIESSIIGR